MKSPAEPGFFVALASAYRATRNFEIDVPIAENAVAIWLAAVSM